MANPETEQSGNPNNQAKQRSWFAVRFGSADAWTALATIFLVVVGIWGVTETRNALKLSERAWVSPLAASLTLPIEEGKVIHYQVILANFGKQPAINTNYNVINGIVKAPSFDDWSNFLVGKNTSCEGLRPIKGSAAIPPGTNGLAINRGFDSGVGADPLVATKSIIDGTFHYYVRGCLAYTTFDEPHTSSFCFILQTKPNVEWNKLPFLPCNAGFEAD